MNCPECDSEKYGFVAKPFDNGNGFHVRLQCRECGYLTAQSFKKEHNTYPTYDHDLYQAYQDNQYKKMREGWTERAELSKQNWHNENDDYYTTPQWYRKRAYVMKRDNNICQMCLTNPAVHVHHLTYIRFRNELTSDLIAVCKLCHGIIHEKEVF